jgi:hypothetical protein
MANGNGIMFGRGRDWRCGRRILGVVVAIALLGPGRVVSASDHAAHGESSQAKPAHGAPAHDEPEVSVDATRSGTHGLELGEFRIRAYYAPESQRSSAAFSLYATVEKDKLTESRHLLAHRLHKLRDQVIVVTRLVPLAEFNDPELKGFRRRILLQLRRALPELEIENVYVSDFELKVERI